KLEAARGPPPRGRPSQRMNTEVNDLLLNKHAVTRVPKSLGQMLLAQELVSESDLARGLAFQARFGGRLSSVLVRIGALSESSLLSVLSEQLDLPILGGTVIPSDPAIVLSTLAQSGLTPEWWLDQEALAWQDPASGQINCIARDPLLPALGEAVDRAFAQDHSVQRSEEHTSELQSLAYLVCRLLLEK